MKHVWTETELWGRKALRCGGCDLHIVDAEFPPAVETEGLLHISLVIENGEPKYGPSSTLPPGKPVRWQTSNVLNYGFAGRTPEEIVAYAENEANRDCVGTNRDSTGDHIRWK